jgi:hypothetical protein
MRLLLLLALAALLRASAVAGARKAAGKPPPPLLRLDLWWFAPFLSGSGYGSEATAFALALQNSSVRLRLTPSGDTPSEALAAGLPAWQHEALRAFAATKIDPERTVAVCHMEPGAWNVRGGPRYRTPHCPPDEAPAFAVGRTMFETDTVPKEWVERMQEMDQLWVPTEFNRRSFAAAGVRAAKIRILPEPVDTAYFDPVAAVPLDLAALGRSITPAGGADHCEAPGCGDAAGPAPFRFLSVFKWEERKGWDILLR